MSKLQTLKKRPQFQRVRGGGRATAAAFVLEGKKREASDACGAATAQFGFTITKKIGNAVTRNLIRRRLKAALTALAPRLADASMDYVVVARGPAAKQDYAALVADLTVALKRVSSAAAKTGAASQAKPPRPAASHKP